MKKKSEHKDGIIVFPKNSEFLKWIKKLEKKIANSKKDNEK